MSTTLGESELTLDEALQQTRTGDIWIFRGRSIADRAIQTVTNSPVNHVGMAVVLDALPPLMWHAELGQALTDVWTGGHHRGVQLHDLGEAVHRWHDVYKQRAWLRQVIPEVGREQEDAVMRAIARWDGAPFPSTAHLAWRWLRGRRDVPEVVERAVARPANRVKRTRQAVRDLWGRVRGDEPVSADAISPTERAYCAEVVALTYEEMGLLPKGRPANWYDPGRFWSGDDLMLTGGWALSEEIAITV